MSRFECRTVFLSDIHLGTRECRAEFLLDFLQRLQCERLVLVGDIFDVWAMRRRVVWTDHQAAAVEHVLEMARQGVEVIYIPGNHDEALRSLIGARIHGIEFRRNLDHITADGRRFLVTHGDEFDHEVQFSPLQHRLGDLAYQCLLRAGHWIHRLRRSLGLPFWSLSAWAKSRVGKAQNYIGRFETAAVRTARTQGYAGFIGGHIHKAALCTRQGIVYANTGDWIEHCTALVEDPSGTLHLVHWSDHGRVDASDPHTTMRPQPLPPGLAWLRTSSN